MVAVNPWVRCDCGKIHVTSIVGIVSKCSCGRKIINNH